MGTYRGITMPGGMNSQTLGRIVVRKSVELTDSMDRGSITDTPDISGTKGAGHRKDASGNPLGSKIGATTSFGNITDQYIIQEHDYGSMDTPTDSVPTVNWANRRKAGIQASKTRA